MMKKLVAVAFAFAVVSAFAEDVKWKAAVSGDWSVGSNWDKSHPPTSADKLQFVDGTYTIHNDTGGDLTLSTMGSNVTGVRSLDLGGHRLTITSNAGMGNYAREPKDGMRFLNGILDCTSGAFPLLGANGAGGNGFWWISTNATYIGYTKSSGSSRILVDGGGCWQLTQDQQFPNATMTLKDGSIYKDGSLVVTGEGSLLKSNDPTTKRQIQMQGYSCRFEVSDGAMAELKNLYLKTSPYSNTTVTVNNGFVSVGVYLTMGYDHAQLPCDHRLQVAGDLGRLEVGTLLDVIDDSGNQFVFTPGPQGYVDADGNPRAALYTKKLTLTARQDGNAHFEKTKLVVDPHLVMFAHPEETFPLIELGTANAAALQALVDNVEFIGFIPSEYESMPTVQVEGNGTLLTLTTPAKKPPMPPAVAFAGDRAGGAEGTRTIAARFDSYGNRSDWASLACVYSLSENLSDPVTQQVASVVSTPLPSTVEFDITGCLQRRTYFCKLVSTNDTGLVCETPAFSFTDAGYYEEFTQIATGDFTWSDPAAWQNDTSDGGFHDDTYPHVEDWAKMNSISAANVTRTITLAEDSGAAITGCGISNLANSHYVFDLCGFTFTLGLTPSSRWMGLGSTEPSRLAIEPTTLSLILKGPGTFDAHVDPGPRLGFNGAGGAGTILVTDGAVYNGKVADWNNGSRVIVEKGSEWILSGDVGMGGGADKSKNYALLAATGTASRITGMGRTVSINQRNSALWLADGASATIGTLMLPNGTVLTNAQCIVEDSSLTVSTMTIGAKGSDCHDLTVRLSGKDAKMAVTTLNVYEGADAKFAFTVPEDGWASAPLTAYDLTLATDRTVAMHGNTRITVALKEWSRRHAKERIEILRLGHTSVANTTALNALKERITFTDVKGRRAEEAAAGVWISDDGLALGITAPPSDGLILLLR